MGKIKLTQSKFAIVDDEDFQRLSRHKWHYADGYAIRTIRTKSGRKNVWMHRDVVETPLNMETDHINHNKLDNRKSNLRICTKSENNMNRKSYKNTSSKYKGVCWRKDTEKWQSQIMINKKLIHLGCFSLEREAADAYNQAAIEKFGEFSSLNQVGI